MRLRFSSWPALLPIFALACVAGCKPSNQYAAPPPKLVKVAHPEQRTITRYFETNGTTASVSQVDLVARVQGFLQAQGYKDGQAVTKGTVLFTIEPPPFQAKLQQAQSQEAAVEAQVAQADAEYTRQASLGKNSFASQSVVDQARATRDANRANLLAAKANTQLAAINLGYTQVVAPFDGVVTAHLVSIGEMVGANGPTKLATIVQLAPIYVTFNMSEQEVERIRAGMAARGVTLEQLGPIPVEVGLQTEQGYPHVGKFDYVSPLVDTATGTVSVRGVFENEGTVLLPGNFVRVRLPLQRNVPALLLPATALRTDQAGSYVLVVGPDDVVAQKRVTVGTEVGEMRAIDTGLGPDDQVVVAGLQRAVPGEKVRPKMQTAAAGK
jgi:RND family efflux transporter MFP subunit